MLVVQTTALAAPMVAAQMSKHRIRSWHGTCSKYGSTVSGGGVGFEPPEGEVVCISCAGDRKRPLTQPPRSGTMKARE